MPRSFLAMAILALFVTSAAGAQTLTGDDARKSLQADAFLAYEHALIEGGLKAAIPYMTPEKLADLKGMAEMFGEEGFNEFFARMRGGAQGEARRRQDYERRIVPISRSMRRQRSQKY